MPTAASASRLSVDEPIERSLAAEETHTYLLPLEEDQYVDLIAEQHGVDVVLKLLDRNGATVAQRDSLTEARGTERLHAVAEVSGEFRVQVESFGVEDDVEDPRYTLHLRALRPAEPRDRTRAAASQAFGEGAYEEALVGWQAVGDTLEEATTRFRLALHHETEQPEIYLRELQTANALFDSLDLSGDVGTRRLHATVLDRLSAHHLEREDFTSAIDAARKATDLYRAVGPEERSLDAWIRIGQGHLHLRRTEDSMRALEQAIDLATDLGLQDKELVARHSLAQIHYQRGALDAARSEWKKVADLARAVGDAKLERDVERWRLRILVREDRFEDALPPLEQRLRTARGPERLALLLDAVELDLGLERLDRAAARIEEGLELSRELKDPYHEGRFLHLEGRRHHARSEHEENLRRQDQALEIFHRLEDTQGELSARYGRAQSLYALGRYSAADDALKKVRELAEGLRSQSLSHDLRASYLAARRHYWELSVDALMRLHDAHPESNFDQVALVLAEQARARSLYEQLAEADARARTEENTDLRRRRRQIQKELQALELGAASGTASDDVTGLLNSLEQVERRLRSRLDLPETPPELSIPALRHEILGPRTRMLTYFLGQDRAYAWLLTRDDVHSAVLDASPGEIETTARAWAAVLPDSNSRAQRKRQDLAVRLGDLLLGPLRDEIPGGRLVVVPDGPLHALPFSALRFPEASSKGRRQYLVERCEVIQLPSITLIEQLGQNRNEPVSEEDETRRTVVVFADPVFSTGESRTLSVPSIPTDEPLLRAARNLGRDRLEPLPSSREEAQAIARAAEAEGRDCRLLLGHEARKDVLFEDDLGPIQVLHFATHGLMDPTHPELSGIVLSRVDDQGRNVDGYLRFHELSDLRLDARLVVLSACETGMGKELRGEGLLSLTRGFFYAGVPRVVASLWSVADESTAALMSRFYRFHLKEGWLPSSALNAAQRTMIEDEKYSDPFHWAAFIYQGDWLAGVGLGDDPVGQMATKDAEPTEPAGDSEIPFVVSLSEEGASQ